MMREKTVYFFRHGETDWNVAGKFQGHIDRPLNARGIEQANALAVVCQELGLELVVSSDLQRAAATSQAVADLAGVPCRVSSAFREVHMGDAEGRTYQENLEEFGEEIMRMWFYIDPSDEPSLHRTFPGGESRRVMYDRFRAGLEEVLDDPDAPDVVGLGAHGGALRIFLTITFPEQAEALRHIPNTALYKATRGEDRVWSFDGLVHEG